MRRSYEWSLFTILWSRDTHSLPRLLKRVSMAAVMSRVQFTRSDAPEMEPVQRVSRAQTHTVDSFKNSTVAKIASHEPLSRKIRQSLMPSADLLLLLPSCNGLVSRIVRTRDQQVNRATLVWLRLCGTVLTSAAHFRTLHLTQQFHWNVLLTIFYCMYIYYVYFSFF